MGKTKKGKLRGNEETKGKLRGDGENEERGKGTKEEWGKGETKGKRETETGEMGKPRGMEK